MAVTGGYFDAVEHDRLYNAEDVGSLLDGIITDGILNTYGSHFEVTRSSGLDVIVGSGRGWFKNTWIKNDDNLTLIAEPNTTGNTRYDTVAIDINKTDAVRANNIIIVTGTSDPAGATLIDEAAHKQYPVANIVVDATGSSITNVIDRRNEIYAQNPLVVRPYWPVGSIFMTMDINFDPAVSFGGIWEQISGRFLIGCGGSSGLNCGDTGGSWEHTITVNNLPSHNHASGNLAISGADVSIGFVRATDGAAVNTVMGWADANGMDRAQAGTTNYLPADWDYPFGFQGSQSGSVDRSTIPIAPSKAVTDEVYSTSNTHYHSISGYTGNAGNGAAMTIRPPYLAVYMWKRVS